MMKFGDLAKFNVGGTFYSDGMPSPIRVNKDDVCIIIKVHERYKSCMIVIVKNVKVSTFITHLENPGLR